MSPDFEVEHDLIRIEINTHVPTKWRLVDLETGEVWRRDENGDLVPATDIRYAYRDPSRRRGGRHSGTVYLRQQDGRWVAKLVVTDPETGIRKRKAFYGRSEDEATQKLVAAMDRELQLLSNA